jgi:C-terminal processing protease CtpA/Prc
MKMPRLLAEREASSLVPRGWAGLCVLFVLVACMPQTAASQDMKMQIDRGHEMLAEIKNDIKNNYYDRNFRGVNLDKRFAEADAQITNAVTGDQIYGIIAETLLAFEDSHTFFIPPVWSFIVEYGWDMQMVGNRCFVTSVGSGSDAEAKGLRPGDEVLAVFDVAITRDNLRQLEYLFRRLRPVKAMTLTVQAPAGRPRKLEILTKVEKTTWATIGEIERQAKKRIQYYRELDGDLFNWKMPRFDLGEKGVDDMMKKVGQHKGLILDLRGNTGGYETALQYLLGFFFDRDVKIGDRLGRKESKPLFARTRGAKAYKGQLIVLVDSRSMSAAEIFARVIQLEKRGIVVGDQTAGAVTGARHFYHAYARRKGFLVSGLAVTYAVSVTVSDLLMTDGKSLERRGVTPDELVLPSPGDLAMEKDPALMRAGLLLGVTLDPRKATPHSFQHEKPVP